MRYDVDSVEEYIDKIPQERQPVIQRLRDVFQENLPEEFEETIQYDMISYVVPLSYYPDGYLGKDDTPLPFISVASQKNHIAIYHMGIYMNQDVLSWFEQQYKDKDIGKLDMGKSCIRFKKFDRIPYDLFGELATKISADEFIELYEGLRK